MANMSAVILRDALPVALRSSDLPVITYDTVGAGRLLHHAYSAAGSAVEKTLGRAAHKLGSGPNAASCRIEKAFGDDDRTRQSRLDSIYDSFQEGTATLQQECFLRALKKDCKKLLDYTLPSQSLATQVHTFRSIIMLTTRYPGLTRIFLQFPAINKVADSPDAIRQLWQNTEYHYDTESYFVLEFAANCLARSNPYTELEIIRPSELGCAGGSGLGVVDRLLVRYCDEGPSFPRLIAIRYLAGILGLPAFWLENFEVQKFTLDKICKQVLRLVEDINPNSLGADDVGRLALLDPDGVDALAEAVLVGGHTWIQRRLQIKELGSHSWVTSFVELIKAIRGLILPNLLPMASRRASGNWEVLFKDIAHQLSESSLDCQYEDVYIFVSERVDSQSAKREPLRSDRAPSDIAKGPLSRLKPIIAAFRSTFLGRTASGYSSSSVTVGAPETTTSEDQPRSSLDSDSTIFHVREDAALSSAGDAHTFHDDASTDSGGPFSGADAAIMAQAFRTALRKSDFVGRPVEEGDSPGHNEAEAEEDDMIGGADAAIMAQAFRTALRQPDFVGGPVDEGNSPGHSDAEAEEDMIGGAGSSRHHGSLALSKELTEEGRDIRRVSSSRGVRVESLPVAASTEESR